uniref:F-box protein n=1 Tax=Globodera rostochiensis TaxID=31243 RepID=A0A914HFR5_GLORO
MSDNVSDEEQQQQMQEIFICADVWLGVFAFLDPLELGLKVALISERFDVLVDKHFMSRKWSLGRLKILREIDGNGAGIAYKRSGELVPIPQGPLPDKVIGFQEIEICYIDQNVIEFLQRIRRLFDSAETSVYVWTSDDQSRSWEIIRQKIWPLINDNIYSLVLDPARLNRLRQFSPAILLDCPNLRSLSCYGLCPEFPAEDNAGASSSQAVAKWVLTPRGDGLPKMLFCLFSGGMDGLKEAFVNASEPVNFIIRVRCSDIEPFVLTNNSTGERFIGGYELLVRCPIGRDEAKCREWQMEAAMWDFCRQWNRVFIDIKDIDIGDGMLDENIEGPSEPKK